MVYSCTVDPMSNVEMERGSETMKLISVVNDDLGRSKTRYSLTRDSLTYEAFVRSENNDLCYIDFRISCSDLESGFLESYFKEINKRSQIAEYLSFKGSECFRLIDSSRQSIAPHIYHFESSHGLVPYITFLLCFDVSGSKEDNRNFIFKSNLFDKGKEVVIEL